MSWAIAATLNIIAFTRQAPEFERMLIDDEIGLVKLWFSVSRSEQRTRFLIRRIDTLRQWKLSPTDVASLDRWDDYTTAKEAMFERTDTALAPLTRPSRRMTKSEPASTPCAMYSRSTITIPDAMTPIVDSPDPLIPSAWPSKCMSKARRPDGVTATARRTLADQLRRTPMKARDRTAGGQGRRGRTGLY